MKRDQVKRILPLALVSSWLLYPQGRPGDWPAFGGDAQRSGFEKVDWRITKDNVKDFQVVLKRKLDTGLTPPVVIGLLISYRGFKELGLVAGSSGSVWAIDVDTDRIFWQRQLPAGCASSIPALVPPTNFASRPRGTAAKETTPAKTAPAKKGKAPTPVRPAGGFGASRVVYAVSGDGKLHTLNSANGEDSKPPLPFLPANSIASNLTVFDNTVYAMSTDCSGGSPAMMAIDPASGKSASFPLAAAAGFAIASDGTVFVPNGDKLQSLHPKSLAPANAFAAAMSSVAPVIFTYKEKDLVVAAGADNRLYLLDAATAAERAHTEPAGSPFKSGLSTWLDSGTRYILAPTAKSIVAYKLQDRAGKLALTEVWKSQEIPDPEKPVITSGTIFTLSAKDPDDAVLYALDGATGKQVYSTGRQVTAPANGNGVTVANGRVYFTTTDGMLYAFGIFLER